MGHTYTLDMTNLVGPLQEIAAFAHQLLLWTCCLIPFSKGLLVSCQHQQHIQLGPCRRWFSTNANIKAMIIISGSYKTYPYRFQA